MSEVSSVLLVDVGNTRLKICLYEPQSQVFNVHSVASVGELVPLLALCSKVLVSSVGDKGVIEQLSQFCEKRKLPLHIAKTERSRFGVNCAYQNYTTLGVDRWLAILAARSITSLPVAVLDLGTAATCDVIIGDEHVGGWIVPGFELMRSALINNTQQVFANQERPDNLEFAVSTEACVNMGCLAAVQGTLLSATKLLSERSDDYRIIICGGDKNLLADLVDERTQMEDNLVIRGLSLFV